MKKPLFFCGRQSKITVVPKNATLLPLLLKRDGRHLKMKSEKETEAERGEKEMQQVRDEEDFWEWLKKLLGL